MLKTYRLEEEAAEWKSFGLQLNIPLNELKEIDEGRLSVDECMTELLRVWIRGQNVATVSDIKRACRSVDNNRLAEELDTNEDIQKIISRRVGVGNKALAEGLDEILGREEEIDHCCEFCFKLNLLCFVGECLTDKHNIRI